MTKMSAIVFDFSGTIVNMRPPVALINKRALRKLSKKYLLGIVTGAKKSETLNIITKLGWEKLFSVIITKDDTKLRKPDSRLLSVVERKLSAKIVNYVGDSKKDQVMAKTKGVPFIFAKDFRSLKW